MSPEAWLDEHGDALYAFAMMRLHNSATAEDVVQETLIAALQGMGKFRQGASVRTWLISIMKNKIIDYLRKATREVPLENDDLDNEIFADQFSDDGHWVSAPKDWQEPLSMLETGEMKQQLLDCISKLPEKMRTLLVLKEFDGFETDDLIQMLNISSASNLWVMLSRARDRLRVCVDNKLGDNKLA